MWTDTAYMTLGDFQKLRDYDWHGRLMFGSDLPVWQAREMVGLTVRYRAYASALQSSGLLEPTTAAFAEFLL